MSERNDIVLRENEGENPPGGVQRIVDELREQLDKTIPVAGDAGRGWLKGKSQQEIAKAMEIRAGVIERIGKLQLAAQAHEDSQAQQSTAEENRHAERMYELETDRVAKEAAAAAEFARALGDAANAIQRLRDLGVEVSVEMMAGLLPKAR